MEGRVCAEERCNCVDFLPFECSLCGKVYCLDHRSRFSHSCEAMAVIQPLVSPVRYASVKEMMDAVERRHDGMKDGNRAEHFQIKSSAPEAPGNGNFAKKLHALDRTAESTTSAKQRKISLKTREMMIKTKAQGNSSVAGADRFFLSVHFTGSLAEAHRDEQHHTEYLFFSSTKTIGEAMQYIWQKYQNVVEHSAVHQARPELHSVKRDHLALVMCTADSPQWQHWDRNWVLRDCLANYEDIAVFPVTVDEVIANQEAIAAAAEQAVHKAAQPTSMDVEDAPHTAREPAKYEKREFKKGQQVWYHKVPAEEGAHLSVAEMEALKPMVMVR
jgi:hypothetical protein